MYVKILKGREADVAPPTCSLHTSHLLTATPVRGGAASVEGDGKCNNKIVKCVQNRER